MSVLKKIGLFLSSFAPLFILIIVKELIEIINGNLTFNGLNTFLILFLLFLIVFGVCAFVFTKKQIDESEKEEIIVVNKQNITDQHFLGYFSLFVLFAVSFEIEMYAMACVFFIVLAFVGIVYIKNDMYYINPLINIFGYSFYDIQFKDKSNNIKTKRVFYKGRLQIGNEYYLKKRYSNFAILADKNAIKKYF